MSEHYPAKRPEFREGSVLAGYRLDRQVGSGGMAVVFRALDLRLGRPVALKILSPALVSDPALRKRFIAESRAAAQVDDPHIIPVYEAGEADGLLFIAMRYVAGGDLGQVLERDGALPPDRAAEFVSPVASALDAAHSAGLVHRDVKPGNILVDRRAGRPDHMYLSDFGIVKDVVSAERLTRVGTPLGTPDYMAPEQIDGRDVDGRADQYSLACVTFQLLTGGVPFERDTAIAVAVAHLTVPPPSLVERRPDLPAAVDRVVAKAMAKTVEKRYESCGDFADALRDVLGLVSYHPSVARIAPPYPAPFVIPPTTPEPPGATETPEPAVPGDPGTRAEDAGPGQWPTINSPLTGDLETTGERADEPDRLTAAVSASDVLAPGQRDQVGADSGSSPAGPRYSGSVSSQIATPPEAGTVPPMPGGRLSAGEASPTPTVTVSMPAPADTDTADSQSAEEREVIRGPAASAEAIPAAGPEEPADDPDRLAVVADSSAEVSDLLAPGQPEPPDPGSDTALVDPQPSIAPHPEIPSPAAPSRFEPLLPAASGSGLAPLGTVDSMPAGPEPPGQAVPAVRPEDIGGAVDEDGAAASPVAAADEGLPAAAAVADSQLPADLAPAARSGQPTGELDRLAATADTNAGVPGVLTTTQPRLPEPDWVQPGQRPPRRRGPVTVWIHRHPLPALALACATLAAALTIPLVPRSPSNPPPPSTSSSPSISSGSPSISAGPTVSPSYTRVRVDLPPNWHVPVASLVFSHSGSTLAIASDNICLADIAAPSCVRIFGTETESSLAFSHDGKTLAAGDVINGSTYLWNVATGKPTATLPGPNTGAYSVAFSPDGHTLAVANSNGSTYLWNVATRKPTATLPGPNTVAYSVAFSPDGHTLAVANSNGNTYLWNVATKSNFDTFPDPGDKGVRSVAFSPDGKILAAGDLNGTTYLWNIATKSHATLPDLGGKGVLSVAYSPVDPTLAVGDENGSIYIWDIDTRKTTNTLADPTGQQINTVAFSTNGKTLATGDQNGEVFLWNFSSHS